MFNFFTKRKKAQIRKQREESKKLKKTERNVAKTSALSKQALDTLEKSHQSHKDLQDKIQAFNKEVQEFQKKVAENQKLQLELQAKEQRLSQWEEDLKDRKEANRKEEMSIHIRKESVAKDEQRLNKKDRDLDQEREDIQRERERIKRREEKSDKEVKKAQESKEKYENLQKEAEKSKKHYEDTLRDLEDRESLCKTKEAEIESRLREVIEKENTFSQKEREMLSSFEESKQKWEEQRAEIEHNLNEKIKEYDRKMADIEAMGETLDAIKFDESEDGKKAKIVVKESIRVGIQTLEDTLHRFKELDEKYASGTFKGFAIPIDEISEANEELRAMYEGVREHIENTKESGLDFGIWLENIEQCLENADTHYKSHLFAECYRAILEGLTYCKAYETMVHLFNDFANMGQESSTEDSQDTWQNYYEFLYEEEYDESTDYTQFDIKDLKRQHKKMAKKYHPDIAPEDKREEHEEIMKRLNEILEILKDTQKRAEYDSTYRANKGI